VAPGEPMGGKKTMATWAVVPGLVEALERIRATLGARDDDGAGDPTTDRETWLRSPDCVVPPLCWLHHRVYDTGRLELLPHLEPQWRAEVAHAVSHLGLIGAVRRLAPRRR
jgi:hypothetical protein